MTLSRHSLFKNLDDAILILIDNLHGQSMLEVFIDERHDVDQRILPTTWSKLKEQYLVRQISNSRWTYTLSGYGWIRGLKLRGEFDTPEIKQNAGKLAAALKQKVKAVNRAYDQHTDVSELASETGLSEAFIRNAIESSLIRELFGTKDAAWDRDGRGRFIRVPNDFGHEP